MPLGSEMESGWDGVGGLQARVGGWSWDTTPARTEPAESPRDLVLPSLCQVVLCFVQWLALPFQAAVACARRRGFGVCTSISPFALPW